MYFGVVCVAAIGPLAFGAPPVRGSAQTARTSIAVPRANISVPRANISVPRANITGTTVQAPPVRIGAAVGSTGSRRHSHGHRHDCHRHTGYRESDSGTRRLYGGSSSLPYTGHARETYTWVSVPVYGRTGGVTHHAYYWHPVVAPPLTETARRVDPGMYTEPIDDIETAPAFRVQDKALSAMRSKDYKQAAQLYQQRWMAIVDSELEIDAGTDAAAERDLVLGALGQSHAEVLRLRAVALVGARRHEHAVRELVRAYEMDPSLARRALFGKELVGDAYRLRRMVNSSVRYAHKSGDADAWVLVAMLMQAEGRDRVARRMLARAAPPRPETTTPNGSARDRPLSIFRD